MSRVGGYDEAEVRRLPPGYLDRKQSALTRKRLGVALLIAIVLHLPAIPSALSTWITMFFTRIEQGEPVPDEVVVPVELDVDLLEGVPHLPPAAPPPASRTVADFGGLDAGIPDKSERTESGEGGAPPAENNDELKPDAGPPPSETNEVPDAGADIADAEVPDAAAPRPPVEDPNKVAGGAAAIAARHPNVRIYLAMDQIRTRPLGKKLGRLLQAIPQWQELLGGTGIDPVRDFDHVLLSGPHMHHTRVVVATVDFNLSVTRMQNAIDAVVRRSKPKGRWLPGSQHRPIAVIGKKGEHTVAVLRKKRMLVVVPSGAKKQLRKLAKVKPFQASTRVAAAFFVVTPWRILMRQRGFSLPKSLKWLRVRVTPSGGGRVLVEADAKDGSAGMAVEHREDIEAQIQAIRGAMFIFKNRYFSKPEFEVDGDIIRARVELSAVQLERILRRAELLLGLEPSLP